MKLADGQNFTKASGYMAAIFIKNIIDDFILILKEKSNSSVSLNAQQYEEIKNEIPKRPVRENPILKIESKPRMSIQSEKSQLDELELEAIALEIVLELLEFAV